VSSPEFTEWLAYYELEPFGPYADDLRHGVLASLFANTFRAQGSTEKKPADFMLSADLGAPKQQSVEEMQHRLRMAFKAMERTRPRVP